MAGKIIGLAGISLTVIILWGITAYGTAYYATAHLWDINIDIPAEILHYFVIYFVLGFLCMEKDQGCVKFSDGSDRVKPFLDEFADIFPKAQ